MQGGGAFQAAWFSWWASPRLGGGLCFLLLLLLCAHAHNNTRRGMHHAIAMQQVQCHDEASRPNRPSTVQASLVKSVLHTLSLLHPPSNQDQIDQIKSS